MFKLLRYFSIASAIGIILIVALLMIFFRHLSVEDLINVGQRQNEILAQSVGNHIWEDFGAYLSRVKDAENESALSGEKTQEIAADLATQIKNLPVLRVDILNLKGLVLFSTAPEQSTRNRQTDPGFVTASGGMPASQIIHLAADDPIAQSLGSQDILSSYLPFYDNQGKVVGAFQIFSDTTLLLADIDHHVLHVFLALAAALGLLYIILFQVIRRADQTIKKQHRDLQLSQTELRESEQRVREIVDTAADAIVTINPSNKITSFNHSAEEIFGVRALDAIGQDIGILISSRHRDTFSQRLREAGDGTGSNIKAKTFDVSGCRKDGSDVLLEVSLSISNMGQEPIFTAIMRDITERKRLE